METRDRHDANVLRVLAGRLGPSLAQGRLLMSELDGCLADIGADAAAKARAIEAMNVAGIELIVDNLAATIDDNSTPDLPRRTVLSEVPVEPVVPRDAVSAGRDRLARDRRVGPGRLQKDVLTANEEVGLTLIARPDGAPLNAGGFSTLVGEAREAADAMVLHNLGLVHSIARRHVGAGLEYEDLVSSGIIGLVRAVEMFDPFRGLKFSTYSTNWIRQSISRSIDDTSRLIRLPVHMCETVRKVAAAQQRMTIDGRRPRWEELAAECGISVEKVEEALRLAPTVISLDTPVGNDGVTLGDLVDAPGGSEEHVELHGFFPEDLGQLLQLLDNREDDVLRRRHGIAPYDEKQTLDEIGLVYGVSRERIRQIESKALTKLRGAVGFDD